MTTLMIQMICVLFLVVFGAMAFYPVFLGGNAADAPTERTADDRVVSVAFGRVDTTGDLAERGIEKFPSAAVPSVPVDDRPAA